MTEPPLYDLRLGNALSVLKGLEAESVHCVCTSPPYWSLRDYSLPPTEWGDGSFCCLGLEERPEQFVAHLVEVFREVRRVLRRDGVCFVNLGDSYASGEIGRKDKGRTSDPSCGRNEKWVHIERQQKPRPAGMKPKDLCLMPHRCAIALQDDGWWVRCDLVWAKLNPMPESVEDRPTRAHEYVFMLTRSERYFWDGDAAREEAKYGRREWRGGFPHETYDAGMSGQKTTRTHTGADPSAGRNLRSVLLLATESYPGAHFACVDEETECLTPSGWKHHDAVADGDLIAQYDPIAHAWHWVPATFHRYPFAGELVVIEKRDSSQRLTVNHRCLIRRRSGSLAVVRADELLPRHEVPTTARYDGDASASIGEDWASLVGWFIAEGHIKKQGGIALYQCLSVNPHHVQTIRGLLLRCDIAFTERRRERFRQGCVQTDVEWYIGVRASASLLAQAPEKQLTPRLTMLPENEAHRLLEALIAADGHARPDGRACIIQKDRQSIELMQILALRLGYRANLSQRPDGMFVLYLTRGEWLTLRSTNGVQTPLGRSHYEGIVWCPSVPSGFWLARRNGKPFITGNTYPTKLIEPLIRAGSSERGCCPECEAPHRRLVDRVVTQPGVGGGCGWSGRDSAAVNGGTRSRMVRGGGFGGGSSSTTGWEPACACDPAAPPVPCIILDPFAGSGTTGAVALSLGRRFLGIEMQPSYLPLIAERLARYEGLGVAPEEAKITGPRTLSLGI